jgi:hypothetical protein
MRFYQEFTFGWIVFAITTPIQVAVTYLYVYEIGTRPISTPAYLVLSLIFLIVYALFFGLTTKVDHDRVEVLFGVGLIRKRIPTASIRDVTLVRSPWYYGWGIRIIPHGMLYSMNGLQGVELAFRDRQEVIRIGSRNPQKLKAEIEFHLK